ncbi:hypothetical protein BC835DRAFT_1309833 [Cytidiella melzeri]|nr:hypothetical protein BC835DRAFT_1309831 [Cytidiella melzeri]KAI0685772.1 hypothetical protein BC835DRAFT_1309833 [Cytidiella melzeri]
MGAQARHPDWRESRIANGWFRDYMKASPLRDFAFISVALVSIASGNIATSTYSGSSLVTPWGTASSAGQAREQGCGLITTMIDHDTCVGMESGYLFLTLHCHSTPDMARALRNKVAHGSEHEELKLVTRSSSRTQLAHRKRGSWISGHEDLTVFFEVSRRMSRI